LTDLQNNFETNWTNLMKESHPKKRQHTAAMKSKNLESFDLSS